MIDSMGKDEARKIAEAEKEKRKKERMMQMAINMEEVKMETTNGG